MSSESSSTLKQDFRLIFILFLAFRLFALFQFEPGGFVRNYSHYDIYPGIAALTDYGLYPFFHFWLEWPPLVPWLMVLAHKLALFIPLWENARLGFVLIFGTILLLFEVGNFYLLYRLARQIWADERLVLRVLWLYAGLFGPVFGLIGAYFDGITLFFILLSLAFILTQRYTASAIVSGVGFMVKLLPVLTLPVAFRVIWFRRSWGGEETPTPSLTLPLEGEGTPPQRGWG